MNRILQDCLNDNKPPQRDILQDRLNGHNNVTRQCDQPRITDYVKRSLEDRLCDDEPTQQDMLEDRLGGTNTDGPPQRYNDNDAKF